MVWLAILKQSIYKDYEHRNIKDWLFNKMYFHRISASAITSHGFAIIFNFIITTAVVYVPKMGDRPCVHYYWTSTPPLFPMTNTALKGWFHKLRFQQKFVKLGLVV